MCDIQLTIERRANRILEADLGIFTPGDSGWWGRLLHYAHLSLATDTPLDRTQTYLHDTGSPEAAEGRLLLRAAERSLREYGDTQEGDEE